MGNKLTFDSPQRFKMRDGSEKDLLAVSINNWRVTTKAGLVQVWLDAEFTDDASNLKTPFFEEPFDILDIGVVVTRTYNSVSYNLIPGIHFQNFKTAGFTDDNALVFLQNIGFLQPGTIS